ncbi:MAG: glycosyltransferase [Candidatus Andersenbacteria bacterium]
MRILVTNNSLAFKSGTSLYAYDICREILRRGHEVVVYSTQLGGVADMLRQATVPVISDIAALTFPPDVIFGMHHLETLTALLQFPGAPCLAFCHGWLPWEEQPLKFPRILHYVAVDDLCRERLLVEHGIPAQRVSTVRNFVDLERFQPREPLPARPRRALILSNNLTEQRVTPAVRAACERLDVAVDVRGAEFGAIADAPETVLPQYDVVFAKARAALEAMAVGAAVIVCDLWGLGRLVTTENYEELRRFNFGIRTLNRPATEATVVGELERYDAADAARVTARVRQEAGLVQAVDELVALATNVVTASRDLVSDAREEARAAAAYVQALAPRSEWIRSLQQQVARLQAAHQHADA